MKTLRFPRTVNFSRHYAWTAGVQRRVYFVTRAGKWKYSTPKTVNRTQNRRDVQSGALPLYNDSLIHIYINISISYRLRSAVIKQAIYRII